MLCLLPADVYVIIFYRRKRSVGADLVFFLQIYVYFNQWPVRLKMNRTVQKGRY